ncbi:MAG: hypothetical protein IJ171_00540 [Ruminococcus sp.]|nr:hypothetical protein [Ruminococcus sp.]
MKKLIVVTGLILVAYLVLMTTLAQQTSAPSAPVTQSEREEQQTEFRIGVQDGRVAVFRHGELYLKTDTAVSSLPKSDRSRIEEGIEIDSLKELKSRLEDYCS